jgi:hypothetical protein
MDEEELVHLHGHNFLGHIPYSSEVFSNSIDNDLASSVGIYTNLLFT